MERRKEQRLRIEYKVTLSFGSGRHQGEGTLINLTASSCGVESAQKVKLGDHVWLQIFPSDHGPAITVESGAVRWVRGQDFGVEFTLVQPREHERLRTLIQALPGHA